MTTNTSLPDASTKASVRLLPLKQINGMIAEIGTTGKHYHTLVNNCLLQCLLHAEKHGNGTPAKNLVQTVKETNPGYIVAGMVKWFNDYSPIRIENEKGADGKPTGNLTVRMAKEGEKDFKEFNTAQAEANPAMTTSEVRDRANRPIVMWNVAEARKMVAGLRRRFEKAAKEGHIEGDTSEQKASNTALIQSFLGTVENAANLWAATPKPVAVTSADAKGTNRSAVTKAKREKRQAKNGEPVTKAA